MDLIRRGAAEIIPEDDLVRKVQNSIKSGKPLRVKLGCDPSRPDLHLGHSVVLRKLRQFQDLGHQAVLIIGDFTAMIGDPSGKSKTRPALTLEETRRNGQTYFEQATKILAAKGIQMAYNSDWLAKMNFADVIRLASKYTVARMLERDDFSERYKAGEPLSVHEFLYPLAQAMDSVAIEADIELGGTDQKFNLLVGRDIQREYGAPPQVILTMPILPGTDGVEKMSKSLDNFISLQDPPDQMYGKTLRIPDELIPTYFLLTTPIPGPEITTIARQLEEKAVNPRDVKRRLARTLVELYYSVEDAGKAEQAFDRIFIEKSVPDEIPELMLPAGSKKTIVDIAVSAGLTQSKGEARRMIDQGGVTIDGEKVTDVNATIPSKKEFILKVGKRKFLRIRTTS
jgi:tyrosyl-tRNA synthetase